MSHEPAIAPTASQAISEQDDSGAGVGVSEDCEQEEWRMSELTCLSLFSGIGGLDLAAQWAGWRTVAFVEIDPFCRRVLRKHWPDVPIFEDVKHVTAQSLAAAGIHSVSLVHGGFPCQPHSVAGKRQAWADERDLWPEFVRVIRETNPRWILGENVPGLLSSASGGFFGNVLRDLAGLGYHAGWCVYGAGDVGASHRRDRVFIVAHCDGSWQLQSQGRFGDQRGRTGDSGIGADLADAAKSGLPSRGQAGIKPQGKKNAAGQVAGFKRRGDVLADTDESGPRGHGGLCECTSQRASWSGSRPDQGGGLPQSRLGRGADGLPSWLDGRWPARPDKPQYDWEPPRTATGIRDRAARLKALGNAVVPQQVYPIFRAIAEVERECSEDGAEGATSCRGATTTA